MRYWSAFSRRPTAWWRATRCTPRSTPPGRSTSRPIDAGPRTPDATGVASYYLGSLDPSLAYSVEFTAYDSRGVESVRSNRLRIAPRLETLGTPLWENNFDVFAPGVHPAGFVDLRGDARP